jgi:hypothetical protein
VVSGLHAGHAGPYLFDNRSALVAQDSRENAFRVFTGQGECVRMTHTSGDVPDQYLAFSWTFHVNFFDNQWLACFPGDGGSRFHGAPC